MGYNPIIQEAVATQSTTVATVPFNNPLLDDGGYILFQATATSTGSVISTLIQTNVTWTLVRKSNSLRNTEIWIGQKTGGVPGSSIAVTCTGVLLCTAQEMNGLDGTSAQQGSASAASTDPTSATITPPSSKSVFILAVFQSQQVMTSGMTNSFTRLADNAGSNRPRAYRVIKLTHGETYNTGYTATSGNWDSVIVAFPLSSLIVDDTASKGSIPPQFTLPGGILNNRPKGTTTSPSTSNNYNISVDGSITLDGALSFVYAAATIVSLGIQRVIHPLWNLPSSIFAKKSRGQYTNNSPVGANYNISVSGSITPDGALNFTFNSHNFAISVGGSIALDGALSFVYHAYTNYNIALSGSIALDGTLAFTYAAAGSLSSLVKSFWLKRHWRF